MGRDSCGRVVFSTGKFLNDCYNVQMAKTISILYGQVAAFSTYRDLICDFDSQVAIRSLSNYDSGLYVFDLIGEDIFIQCVIRLLLSIVTRLPTS